MALLKGITVNLIEKTNRGKDAFNRPIWEESVIPVDNVLISPVSQTDVAILNEMSLNGKKASYLLAIPKGDSHTWEDTEVEFFGKRWRTVGFSTMGIEKLIPLEWNRKVVVERCE